MAGYAAMRYVGAVVIALWTGFAVAEEPPAPAPPAWVHIGPLRIRDLTPFGILRMDFLPAHAVPARKGTWAVEVNFSYQNTWVLSPNVADYMRTKGGGSRLHLGAEDVPALLALPGEAYIVDGELGVIDFTVHHRFGAHWGGYLTVPALLYEDGFLDSTIEGFHDLVGLDNADRDLAVRNNFFVFSKTKSGDLVMDTPPHDGFADPVIAARYSVVPIPDRWNVIAEAAVKPAFRGARPFVASGNTDYGVQVSAQGFFKRHALYLSGNIVNYGGVDIEGISDDRMWVPSGVLGWEFKLGRTVNGIIQVYASPSVIQDTDLEDLRKNKYLTSLGLQGHAKTWFWRMALTENLVTFENTADIALTLSIAKTFPPH